MLLLNHPDNLFSFQEYLIKIAKLNISVVLVNIKNIHVKYSHCGPIHLKLYHLVSVQGHVIITDSNHGINSHQSQRTTDRQHFQTPSHLG